MSEVRTRGYHPKIWIMKEAQDAHERLRDDIEAVRNRRIDNREQFEAMLAEIKRLDPAGWETWYDDNSNIPAELLWDNMTAVFAAMKSRIEHLSGKPYTYKPKRDIWFQWWITRPAKRGKKRVFVRTVQLTKSLFAEWWKKNRQPGWRAEVIFNPLKIERRLQKFKETRQ
jgi:hypothetical protein